jgi:arsenate reductase
MKRILIICTGNTCRSQMAQGILKKLLPGYEIVSAGTRAESRVNPFAIEVMKESGIDISGGIPRSVEEFLGDHFDYVITVCDGAREVCPVFTGMVRQRLHIGFPDPAEARGDREEVLAIYRSVRDDIIRKFTEFAKQIQTNK